MKNKQEVRVVQFGMVAVLALAAILPGVAYAALERPMATEAPGATSVLVAPMPKMTREVQAENRRQASFSYASPTSDTSDKVWGCEHRKLDAGTINTSVLDCRWH